MKQIPDRLDLEEVSKACDYVMEFMRTRHESNDTLISSMATICAFVYRVKANAAWLENFVDAIKEAQKQKKEAEESWKP